MERPANLYLTSLPLVATIYYFTPFQSLIIPYVGMPPNKPRSRDIMCHHQGWRSLMSSILASKSTSDLKPLDLHIWIQYMLEPVLKFHILPQPYLGPHQTLYAQENVAVTPLRSPYMELTSSDIPYVDLNIWNVCQSSWVPNGAILRSSVCSSTGDLCHCGPECARVAKDFSRNENNIDAKQKYWIRLHQNAIIAAYDYIISFQLMQFGACPAARWAPARVSLLLVNDHMGLLLVLCSSAGSTCYSRC